MHSSAFDGKLSCSVVHKPIAKSVSTARGLCKNENMLMGYARVSKENGQDTATQVAALKTAGMERLYEEHASGGRWDRPELHRALDQLRRGDIFVVWQLDRLSGSRKAFL